MYFRRFAAAIATSAIAVVVVLLLLLLLMEQMVIVSAHTQCFLRFYHRNRNVIRTWQDL